MELLKKIEKPNHKFLVFTSAGDSSALKLWKKSNDTAEFDLFVCCYSDLTTYIDVADYYAEHKGGKFPNLHAAYKEHRHIFQQYTAILVADDDVITTSEDINHLFNTLIQEDLWVLQASFSRKSKVSFLETLNNPTSKLRYTNFVEMTCPLFKREKLEEFLDEFEPKLVGWGADIWFCGKIINTETRRCAIIDSVQCTNPKDACKPKGEREINKLQTTEERQKIWTEIANRLGYPTTLDGIKTYKRIPISWYQYLSPMRIFNLLLYIKYCQVTKYHAKKRNIAN